MASRIFCDVCDRHITENHIWKANVTVKPESGVMGSLNKQLDLCTGCARRLKNATEMIEQERAVAG